MGLSLDLLARLVRRVYGARGAGKLWEDPRVRAMEQNGFVTVTNNPCVFHHTVRDIAVVVHGDDVTASVADSDLD